MTGMQVLACIVGIYHDWDRGFGLSSCHLS